jgi:bifunctional DNA-binding transcriptional regulator/antitoxin component of YhaV-PrlF toxin-antitoxin module
MTESNQKVKYEVITQEDENGDLLLPLPPELLQQMGWKEGDTLDFSIDDKGRWIIKKI